MPPPQERKDRLRGRGVLAVPRAVGPPRWRCRERRGSQTPLALASQPWSCPGGWKGRCSLPGCCVPGGRVPPPSPLILFQPLNPFPARGAGLGRTLGGRRGWRASDSDFFRKLDPNVCINSVIRKIKRDRPEVALICDVRFRNEIVELQKEGAYIVGLTRDPYSKADQHVSEKEIEEALSLCDSICDNSKVGIKDSIKMVHNGLKGLPNVIPRMEK